MCYNVAQELKNSDFLTEKLAMANFLSRSKRSSVSFNRVLAVANFLLIQYGNGERHMKLKKILYIIVGCIGLGLGALGAVFPMIPTVPFLLLAAFCFGRSSEKLHTWFVGTKLYRDNLEDYVAGKGMTKKTKIRIMATVTLLMSIGFIMMDAVPVGRAVLTCVWVIHVIYFVWGVKTIPAEEAAEAAA